MFGCHGLVRFYCFWLSQSRPLLLCLAVTVSSASTVLGIHASTVIGRHGLVSFFSFWLSRARPLLLFVAVTVSSASTVFGCHSLVRFHCFWLSRSRPLLLFSAVTVSSASIVFGRHGLVRFYCFWLSRSRALVLFLAVTVSSASTVVGRHGLVGFTVFGFHGLVLKKGAQHFYRRPVRENKLQQTKTRESQQAKKTQGKGQKQSNATITRKMFSSNIPTLLLVRRKERKQDVQTKTY